MISTQRATKLYAEPDPEKRRAMIEKLTEEDAKYMLRVCIMVMKGETDFPPKI